jgi:hypothetical protein
MLMLACAKHQEQAKPAPEVKASAAPDYPDEARICTDGKLGFVAPPAAPKTADAGIGLGMIGTGPFGFSYSRTSIVGRPAGRGARSRAVARGACSAIPAFHSCLAENFPEGSLELEVVIDNGRATVAAKPNALDPDVVACVVRTLTAATFETAATGTTAYTLTFSMLRPTRTEQSVVVTEMRTTVTGDYSRPIVKAIIGKDLPRVRACYEAGVAKAPALAGKVSLSFAIDKMGKPRDAKVLSSELDGNVTSCIMKVFQSLAFPEPPSGAVQVQWMADFWKP